MKQSHRLRCEVVTVQMCRTSGATAERIRDAVQERLDLGWTLRAAPVEDGAWIHLVFVRKEAG